MNDAMPMNASRRLSTLLPIGSGIELSVKWSAANAKL
jgi:hypothetical protein